MLIHLVRHGHAGSRSDYDGDDSQRPLTKRGRREAEEIAHQLKGSGVDLIWSSWFVRCRETLGPLAEDLGLDVSDHPAFAEGGYGPPALEALLAAVAEGHTVAVCSHGDVIPALVDTAIRRGATLDGPPSPAKGARYETDVVDGQVVRLTHIPRPEV